MLTEIEIKELKEAATEVRRNIVKMVHNSKSGHPGGSLSGADILTVLYKKSLNIPSEWDKSADFENRDRFILSKGHASPLLYSIYFYVIKLLNNVAKTIVNTLFRIINLIFLEFYI